jgi:small conductance mechanosensitive channel
MIQQDTTVVPADTTSSGLLRALEALGLESNEVVVKAIEAAAILILAWAAIRLAKLLLDRLQRRLADEDAATDTADNQRARTLTQLLRSLITAVVGIGAGLTVLDLFFPIGPLLAGIGVLGLAVSFGAQSLVKDVIAGFFILLENQFAIGDIVEVNGKSGVVERITMRIVGLRDVEGTLHIIPNGSITVVSNKTRVWARAVLDIGIAYKESVDDVIQVVQSEAEKFWRDPDWQPKLVNPPVVWGVQDLAESSVNVRLIADTKPAQQWGVRRELLRRIKNRFDQEGIEIPFPQRTLHLAQTDALMQLLARNR